MARRYGRARKGELCRAPVPHGHWKTTTFVGALRHNRMTASMVLDGPMNGAAFQAYAEHIRLDATGLHVSSMAGRRVLRRWHFEPYWVQVRLDHDRPGEPTLRLAAHGRRLTIGRFLNADERRDFARALQAALAPYRPTPG